MANYTLPELDYDYAALAPHISATIMELHHSKHHKAYVDGANTALEKLAEAREKNDFANINKLQKDLAFHLSGHINHPIFWNNLAPTNSDRPDGESVGHMIDLLSGALWPWAPPLGTAVVDVRDVADGLIRAAEKGRPGQRYILANQRASSLVEVIEALKLGQVDLVGSANGYEAADKGLVLSRSYANDQPVLITRAGDSHLLSADLAGVPPTVAITSPNASNLVYEGAPLTVTVDAVDDVRLDRIAAGVRGHAVGNLEAHAHQRGHARVLGGGAHGAAQVGAVDQPHQQRQHDDRGGEDGDLGDGEHGAEEVDRLARQRGGIGLGVGLPDDHRQRLQQDGNPDGGDQRRQAR